MAHLDGNVLAGQLHGFFAFEPTTAQGQCGGCGDIAVLAQAAVFGQPMGSVVRCRNCGDVLMVIVERQGQTSFSMRGLRWVAAPDSV